MDIDKSIQILQTEENELSLLEQNEQVKQYLLKINEHQKSIEEFKKQLKQHMLDKNLDKLTNEDESITATITKAYSVQIENIDNISDDFITLEPLDTDHLVFDDEDNAFIKTPNLELARNYAKTGSVPNGFEKIELTPKFSLKINGKAI